MEHTVLQDINIFTWHLLNKNMEYTQTTTAGDIKVNYIYVNGQDK